MDDLKVIEIKKSVFAANEIDADELRKDLKKRGIFLLNVMSSPGSGKTTTLCKLISKLQEHFKVGVMEADIDSDVDARTIAEKTGAKAIQLHTGGMCHLDASMTKVGLDGLELDDVNFVILENVGNLVCPAEFDTGACMSLTILSVPEGDDKPLKYPLMYKVCELAVINKIDVLPYFDFDMEKVTDNIHFRNPNCEIIPISAKTGEGIDELAKSLISKAKKWLGGE